MKYKIKSSLIEPSWFEDAIFKTLDMYRAGEDLKYSPMNEFQRNFKSWGGKHRSLIGKDLETGIKERMKEFLDLYESIKKEGYREDSPPIFVYFDDDGFIRLYDGHHRLSIVRYLKKNNLTTAIDPLIEVSTYWDSKGIDPTGIKGRDFPLVEIASSIWNGQKKLYHYVNDPKDRLNGFVRQRPDSTERRDYILKNLTQPEKGKFIEEITVLDIGCSEGYLSHEIAKKGFNVTGIEYGYKGERDRGRKLLAITRYLATIQNIKMNCILGDWKDLIRKPGIKFDNILYLSVLHNEVNALGAEKAFDNLELFRGKCQRLFVEIPNIQDQRDWTSCFKMEEILPTLERRTKMKIQEVWEGYRPIVLLTNELKKVRLTKDKKIMETAINENVNGCKMQLIKNDHPLTDSIMETGKWEEKTTEFIKSNLRSGQTFVDVGASVGYYTLLAAKLVGSGGKVYSFEPLQENYSVLTKNLADNNFKNVTVFFNALSNQAGPKIKLFGGDVPGQYSLLDAADHNFREVNNDIFDELNKREGIIPDIIKIDVEGAQMKVLEGMKEVLETDRELTIILEDYTGEAVEWLMKRGFEIVTTEREAGNYMLVKNRKEIKAEEEPITFHLLGTFNTPTNLTDGIGYAFCAKIINIAKALRSQGHKVIFYGAEGSEVECDEFVQVLDKKDLPVEVWHNKYVENGEHPANQIFNTRCIAEIIKRKSKYFHSRDILLVPTGSYQKPVADAVGLKLLAEIGIGYKGIFTEHKIFESYAWQHWHYGKLNQSEGKFYDAVIPPIFDPKDFEYREKKGDYFLYLGRIVHNKGVTIAKETCEAIGAKLKVAGIDQGMKFKEGPNLEMVGFADLEKRKELIAGAKAVFVPTIYIEPFGYIIMEAAMSGTPVITTDWGAFPEIVQHGKTGFRCRTLAQFIMAAQNIDQIKPADCREWAMEFTLEKIAPMYDQYFKQMQNLFGRGWYSQVELKK